MYDFSAHLDTTKAATQTVVPGRSQRGLSRSWAGVRGADLSAHVSSGQGAGKTRASGDLVSMMLDDTFIFS